MSEHARKVFDHLDRSIDEEIAYHEKEARDAHEAYRALARELSIEQRHNRELRQRNRDLVARCGELYEQVERARDWAALALTPPKES